MVDILSRYGMLLWFLVAVLCIVSGLILTLAKQRRLKRPSTAGQVRHPTPALAFPISPLSAPSRVCPGCGQRADDQKACFCGSCGASLLSTTSSRRAATPGTIRVDEHTLEREIYRAGRARWK